MEPEDYGPRYARIVGWLTLLIGLALIGVAFLGSETDIEKRARDACEFGLRFRGTPAVCPPQGGALRPLLATLGAVAAATGALLIMLAAILAALLRERPKGNLSTHD